MTFVCKRCGRELHPWPIKRPRGCSPAKWVHCIRPYDDGQWTEDES